MSRGTRFLTLAIPVALVYILMFFGVLPVPLLSQESADQILPVVSVHLLPLARPAITRSNADVYSFHSGYSSHSGLTRSPRLDWA